MIKLAVNGLARQVANHDDILFIPLKAVHRLDLAVKPKPWVAAFRMYPLWLIAKLTTRKTHIWVVQFQLGYIYIYLIYWLQYSLRIEQCTMEAMAKKGWMIYLLFKLWLSQTATYNFHLFMSMYHQFLCPSYHHSTNLWKATNRNTTILVGYIAIFGWFHPMVLLLKSPLPKGPQEVRFEHQSHRQVTSFTFFCSFLAWTFRAARPGDHEGLSSI